MEPVVDPAKLRMESIGVAAEIIDEVLSSGGNELYRHYLDDRLSGFAVRMATEEMLEVVKWHFMSRDEGEGALTEKSSWQIDEEPEPAEIDSWARGALRTRKKPVASPPPTGAVAEKDTAKRSRRSRRPSQDNGSKPPTSGLESPTSAGSRAVSSGTGTGTTKKKSDKDNQPKPPSAAERQRKLVEEARAKRAVEAKAEQDQLSKIQKELKGKEYTYDRNGAIIVIDELDASKLPAHSVTPQVNVKSGGGQDFSDEVTQLKKVMKDARPKEGGSDAEKAKTAALQRQQEQQPSLLESMDVAEGVVLTEGAKTKAGPQRKADANHMSMKDFQSYGGGTGRPEPLSSAPVDAGATEMPPPPEPEPEVEEDPVFDAPSGGSPGGGDSVPLKDLPHPPKASQRQREEQMGKDRLRFPRDRPHVNPTLPTRPIMPDKTSNLASNQDSTRFQTEHDRSAPKSEILGKTREADKSTMAATNRLQTVDERLAKQLLQPDR